MDMIGISPEHTYKMCEVLFKDANGTWPKMTSFDQLQEFKGFAIGYFKEYSSKAGTGFVVKNLKTHPKYCSIILTAAHVFIDQFQYKNTSKKFKIGNETYKAIPLKKSLDWDNKSLYYKDPISRVPICFPEDCVLCGLVKYKQKNYTQTLMKLTLCYEAISLNIHDEVFVVGYPSSPEPKNLKLFAPSSSQRELKQIKKCVLNGNSLACSQGEILAIGEMLAVSCPAANGMSGSPLFKRTQFGNVVIGFLFGGPASQIHWNVVQLMRCPNAVGNPIYQNLSQYLRQNIPQSNKVQNLCEKLEQCELLNSRCPTEQLLRLYAKAVMYENQTGRFMNYNNFQLISSFFSELHFYLSECQ